MKIIRLLVVCFYVCFVMPVMVVFMGSLIYGGIVETIKTMKKS